MEDLFHGLVVGIALAAPVGPVGLICIRLALTQGLWPAVAAGMGAATADAIFGAIGGLGLSLIQKFITANQTTLGVIGAVILIILGAAAWRQPVELDERQLTLDTMIKDFSASFTLAITNPATLVAALGLFAALGSVNPANRPVAATLLVGGVFVGSALWWLFLAKLTTALRQRMRNSLGVINKASSVVFVTLGVAVLIGVLTAQS